MATKRITVADVFAAYEVDIQWLGQAQLKAVCSKCNNPRGEHAAVSKAGDEHWCPLPPGQGQAQFSETDRFTA